MQRFRRNSFASKRIYKNELIRILGYDNAETSDSLKVSDKYVPVNATFIPLASADKHLKVGDKIRVIRPCTPEWLAELGTDRLGNQQEYNFSKWQPGQYTMAWERNVTQVSKEGIEIDVPITMSLDPEYGGGYVTPLKWTGHIYNIGIENLCCISDFDAANPKDENHRWQAITFNHIQDGWVRRVTAKHLPVRQ